MERLIAHIKVTSDLTSDISKWYLDLEGQNLEFSFKDGIEIDHNEIKQELLAIARKEIKLKYQDDIPYDSVEFPRVKVIDSYEGSLIFELVVYTIASVYGTSKIITNIPKYFKGVKELEFRIRRKYNEYLNKKVKDKIQGKTSQSIPKQIIDVIKTSVSILLDNEEIKNTSEKVVPSQTITKGESSNEKINTVKYWKNYILPLSIINFLGMLSLFGLYRQIQQPIDLSILKKRVNKIEILTNENSSKITEMKKSIEVLEEINQEEERLARKLNKLIDELQESGHITIK